MLEKQELQSLLIDIANNRFEINGKDMAGISSLSIGFQNGKWSLFVTKDIIYVQSETDMERRVSNCENTIKKILEERVNDTDELKKVLAEMQINFAKAVEEIRDVIKEDIMDSIRLNH